MKRFVFILLMLPWALFGVEMNHNGIVTKESNKSVDDTIAVIEGMVKKMQPKGMNLFAIIDHQANAKNAGGAVLDEAKLIIFGNPKVGLYMMTHDPAVGLDLPLKVLVYKNKEGKVIVKYRDPKFFKNIYNVGGANEAMKMSGALDKFTENAIK